MGHHFDSPEARADSRINLSDNYLFQSPDAPGHVVAILCASPLAGLPSPYHGNPQWRTFRPATAYELRFDTDGDLRPDATLRLLFAGNELRQTFEAYWLADAQARDESAVGTRIATGTTGDTVSLERGGRLWIGEAGDPFWLDAVAAKQYLDARLAGSEPAPDTFSSGAVTTGATNVLAIVAELPLALIGGPRFNFWTAVAANDHGHWHQVARCGRPNFAATFVDDPQRSRRMNESTPELDRAEFSADVRRVVTRVAARATPPFDPAGYAERVAAWLLPDVIPFDAALPAGFDFAGINGRRLSDDFGAVVYSAVFNQPMRTALAPLADLRGAWPWLPPPRPLPAGPAVAVPERSGG